MSGLDEFLRLENIGACIDATHPYATTMSAHAVQACENATVPLARYVRAGWATRADAGSWHWVDSYAQAASKANALGRRPFITTGRQTLEHFQDWSDRSVLVRVVEALTITTPQSWVVIHDRGPYVLADELELMQRHNIDVLLTKDSGGSCTEAKLEAAATLGVPVVVARPAVDAFERELATVSEAVEWLIGLQAAQ